MNLLRKLLNRIRLWFIVKKVDNTTHPSYSSPNGIIPETTINTVDKNAEQEVPWFQQESILMNIDLDPPIVYAGVGSNIINKQDQYGYIGDDATKTEEDEFDKSWNIEGAIGYSVEALERINKDRTAKFLTKQQEFEERWRRIQEQVKEENELVDIRETKLPEPEKLPEDVQN